MSITVMKHFDLLDFVNKSTELGMSKPLAEYQARRLEEVIEIAVASNQDSITNKNLILEKEIKDLEYAFQNDFKEQDVKITSLQKDIKDLQKDINEIRKEIKILELKMQEGDTRLEVKIEQSKNQIIIWMGSFLIASGLITHFFK